MRAEPSQGGASQRFGLRGLMLAAVIGLGLGTTAKAQPVPKRDAARSTPLPSVLTAADAQRMSRAVGAAVQRLEAA
jgi:hypothetical protein